MPCPFASKVIWPAVSSTRLFFVLMSIYLEFDMSEDTRCCGTGTCLINAEGVCWCGQRWNGETMCRPNGDETEPSLESEEDGEQTQEA
jgi:hypothetical protein